MEKYVQDSTTDLYLQLNTSFYINEFLKAMNERRYNDANQSAFMNAVNWIFDDPRKAFVTSMPSGKHLFRSRIIKSSEYDKFSDNGIFVKDDDKLVGYDEFNSREPCVFSAKPGRNNTFGQSYLYLADDKFTAMNETKPNIKSLISCAIFIIRKELSIIDFSSDKDFENAEEFYRLYGMKPGRFFTWIMQSYRRPVEAEDDYQITQMISEHIRKAGYDGICYQSSYGTGKNYTIFNSHKNNISFEGSEVFYYYRSSSFYMDVNERKNVKRFSCSSYSQQQIEDNCSDIITSIKRYRKEK